jgi:hypothetical protein
VGILRHAKKSAIFGGKTLSGHHGMNPPENATTQARVFTSASLTNTLLAESVWEGSGGREPGLRKLEKILLVIDAV